jgi:histidine triad (HIT) family protein
MGSCVFCEIAQGRAPASIVYADASVLAFMDIQPVNPGHVLVVPRSHARHLADLSGDTGARLFRTAMRLAGALRRSDGEAAGQEVLHVHLHVVPRFRGDGFGLRFGPTYGERPDQAALDAVAAEIRQALGG